MQKLVLLLALTSGAFAVGQETTVSIIDSPPTSASVPDPANQPGPMTVGVPEPISYLVAGAAEVLERPDGKVMIITEGLEPKVRYAVVLPVENPRVTWIEVYPDGNPPAQIIQHQPGKPGSFVIEGDPGQEFDVRVPNGWDPPVWLKVKIEGGSGPDPDPDPAITELSKARADALNDPPTRSALKAEVLRVADKIALLCEGAQCPSQGAAEAMFVAGIEGNVMAKRTGDSEYVEWKVGWRTPVGNAIKASEPQSTMAYVSLMRDAAAGL